MIRYLPLAALCLMLPACEQARKDRISFDGQFFRSKASFEDRSNRETFTVAVRPASASLTGALEAGRHEAIKYCIDTFGNSKIVWAVGPDNPPETYVLDGETLTLSGTCEG